MRLEEQFILQVDPGRRRIVLSRQAADGAGVLHLITCGRASFPRILPAVQGFLPQGGRDLDGRPRCYRLGEAEGARMALLLWALTARLRPGRAMLVRQGIAAMSTAEVYYWFARVLLRHRRAIRALRILLAGE